MPAQISAGPSTLHRLCRGAVSRLRDLRADACGAAAVAAAILFPVLLGGMGLGAETGYWYLTQRKLQHTADVAAHAGGVRLRAGDSQGEIGAAAHRVAGESGVDGPLVSLTVNTPPLGGGFAGDPDSVEVVIVRSQPRWFSAIFDDQPVEMSARAVARITQTGSVACVLALSATAPGAVTVTGSTAVGLSGCDVASNSNAADAFLLSGSSAALAANCAFTVGRAITTSGLELTGCEAVQENAPSVRDPYADVAEPAVVGACRNRNVGSPNSSTTLTPTENHPSGMKSMRFCNGMDVKGQVTFEPGLYIIEGGDFTINSGNVDSSSLAVLSGGGVTFYLTNGARLRLGGNGVLTLSAPTNGPFSGILFFGSRGANDITHRLTGGHGSTTQGAAYMPVSHVEFRGNSKTTNGCTQIVGRRVTFTGNSSLRSDCEAAGTRDIATAEVVRLVE